MVTNSQEILDSLNVDLSKEHAAIYQYELHAAQLHDSVLEADVRGMAREEMWHMEWLIEAISERGGTPTLARADLFLSEDLAQSLRADVSAEDGALQHYGVSLALIGDSDEELTRLVQRIMDDERYHRTSFASMADKVGAEGDATFAPPPIMSPADAVTAAPVTQMEYEGLLQYLWNKYGCGDCEQAETYFELAMDEMRHLGRISQHFASLGPPMPPPDVSGHIDEVRTTTGAFDRAESYERHAADVVGRVEDAVAGEGVRSELRRIAYQHAYHRFVLEHMEDMEGVETPSTPRGAPMPR